MDNFVFQNRTKIVFGKDSVDNVGEETARIGGKILLVTGGGSVRPTGLLDKSVTMCERAGLTLEFLEGVEANPDVESVREGVNICRSKDVDALLAIGGGSVIDAAKAIALASQYEGDPWDLFGKKIKPESALPLGVVLTLSATGSEANGNTVISNRALGRKAAYYHPELYPRFSILDPTLTYSVPADQTAFGSIDILTHVYEQYFHTAKDTPLQDGIAESIIQTALRNTPVALDNPTDYTARANLMWGGALALNGLLSSGAKGDWACHIIGHELTARYGIAHGAVLGVLFPAWMKKIYPRDIDRFYQFAVNVWGVTPNTEEKEKVVLAGIEVIKKFYKEKLGVGVTLKDYGIDDKKFDLMAEAATGSGTLGGFAALSKEDVRDILLLAL